MKHPIYLTIAALTCMYLLVANWRGWTLFAGRPGGGWGTAGRSVYHK